MTDFVNTIDLLGDEATAQAIIDKTIKEFNDDVVNMIGTHAFFRCASLESVNIPNVTYIDEYAFAYTALTSAHLPNVTTVRGGGLAYNTALVSVYLPNVTTVGGNALYGCTSLKSLSLPKVERVSNSEFESCSALSILDFGSLTYFGNAISRNKNLSTIILRSETLCVLTATSNFYGTPFASNGTGGTVYVPSALISQYQNATNWSTLYAAGTCNFVAIEGSEYE